MCGISGVISNYLTNPEIERFEDLMLVSNLRGSNGAGVISYRREPKEKDASQCTYTKTIGNGIDVVGLDTYKAMINDRPKLLIGHTRAPTKGDAKDRKNVHPHLFGDIIGVHNGTLDRVNDVYVGCNRSDSAAFFEHLSKVGIDEAMKGLSGAYAFVWINTEEATLNFLKNDKRPLWFATPEGNHKGTLWWSSEPGMLLFVHARYSNKIEVKPVPNDTLITISLDKGFGYEKGTKGWTERELKAEVKHVNVPFHPNTPAFMGPPQVSMKTTNLSSGHNSQMNNGIAVLPNGANDGKKKTFKPLAHATKQALSTLVEHPNASRKELVQLLKVENPSTSKRQLRKQISLATKEIKTFGNHYVPKWKLTQILNKGCDWCGNPEEHYHKAVFFDKESFVCTDCAATPEVQQYLGIQVN